MNQNYSQTIKDHYHHPKNFGKLADVDLVTEQINLLCGDETKIYLKIENGVIKNISHETRGCMIAIAAASVVSEYAKGKKLSEIKKLGSDDIAKLLNVSISPARQQCALLFLKAIAR